MNRPPVRLDLTPLAVMVSASGHVERDAQLILDQMEALGWELKPRPMTRMERELATPSPRSDDWHKWNISQ